MMQKYMMTCSIKRQQGFSIIELMVAMVIGLVLMSGVFSVFVNSKENQDIIFDQVELIDESRVAVEILAYDLKRAGLWGKTNAARQLFDNEAAYTSVFNQLAGSSDCVNSAGNQGFNGLDIGWALDATRPVYGFSEEYITANGFPYTDCISGSYLRGDTVEVRYAGERIAKTNLDDSTVYIVSQGQFSELFFGATPKDQPQGAKDNGWGVDPALFPAVTYHQYEAILYYVSSWTDAADDGVPSLRRVSLQAGPSVVDEVVLTGVENLQIQFGLDTDNNSSVETVQKYSDPSLISSSQWSQVRSAQVWLVVKAKQSRTDNVGQVFNIPAVPGGTYPATAPTDGFKRFMASTTVKLRNIEFVEGK